MTVLKVKKYEFFYEAGLVTPALQLAAKWGDLVTVVMKHLSPLGATAESLVFESTSTHPKDFILACYLPNRSSVRFRAKSFDVWASGAALVQDPGRRLLLVKNAFGILDEMGVDRKLDFQNYWSWCHGQLSEGTFALLAAKYVTSTPGGMDVSGLSFRRDLDSAGQGFIDLQPSYSIPGPSSAFASGTVRAPGHLSPEVLEDEAQRFFDASWMAVNLEPDWTTTE